MSKERWEYYQCTNPKCGNQFEAKRTPKQCDVCGEPVTKRPSDNHYYDYDKQTWVEANDED